MKIYVLSFFCLFQLYAMDFTGKEFQYASAPALDRPSENLFEHSDPASFGFSLADKDVIDLFFENGVLKNEYLFDRTNYINVIRRNHYCGGICFRAYEGDPQWCCRSAKYCWTKGWIFHRMLRDKKGCSNDPSDNTHCTNGCKQWSYDDPKSCCNALSIENRTNSASRYCSSYSCYFISDAWRVASASICGTPVDAISTFFRAAGSLILGSCHGCCLLGVECNDQATSHLRDTISLIYDGNPPILNEYQRAVIVMAVGHLGFEKTKSIITNNIDELKVAVLIDLYKKLRQPVEVSMKFLEVAGANHTFSQMMKARTDSIVLQEVQQLCSKDNDSKIVTKVSNLIKNTLTQYNHDAMGLLPAMNAESYMVMMIWTSLLVKQNPIVFDIEKVSVPREHIMLDDEYEKYHH